MSGVYSTELDSSTNLVTPQRIGHYPKELWNNLNDRVDLYIVITVEKFTVLG